MTWEAFALALVALVAMIWLVREIIEGLHRVLENGGGKKWWSVLMILVALVAICWLHHEFLKPVLPTARVKATDGP